MTTLTPSSTLVRAGLARPKRKPPASPALSRRGRWSPPLPPT